MKKLIIAAAALSLAACAPPQSNTGAEDAVLELYAAVSENIGQRITPLESIPMTEDLRDLVTRAEAAADARGEPFIEGDIAANCQDCTSLTNLVIGAQTGPEPIPAAEGHRMVEARFTLNGTEPRAVLYDMVETPDGWRVDNVLTEGFNLRDEAQSFLAATDADAEPTPPAP